MKLVKFVNSSQLFKFCQKVLSDQRGKKIHDQEVGSILNFNPSDCSHWKKGEKNVKSVFALEKLAKYLKVEIALIQGLASGAMTFDEVYFEYQEGLSFEANYKKALTCGAEVFNATRERIYRFVAEYQVKAGFKTPPLYLPELLQFFPFISLQPTDMMDRLSRILRIRPQQYVIQCRKGELRPQTRMSIVGDLARIILSSERSRYQAVLGEGQESLLAFERAVFIAAFLAPREMFANELIKLDSRKNIIAELAATFWVPKSLISFQLQDLIRHQNESAEVQQSMNSSQRRESLYSVTQPSAL